MEGLTSLFEKCAYNGSGRVYGSKGHCLLNAAESVEKSSGFSQYQEPWDAARARMRRDSASGGPKTGSHFLRGFLMGNVELLLSEDEDDDDVMSADALRLGFGDVSGDPPNETIGRVTRGWVETLLADLLSSCDRSSVTRFRLPRPESTK